VRSPTERRATQSASILEAFRCFGTAARRYQVVVDVENLENRVRDESVRIRVESDGPGNLVVLFATWRALDGALKGRLKWTTGR
jgi:hypothetical protein